MRNNVVLGLAAIGVLAFAGAASADTSVYNRFSTTNQYNGYTETNVDAVIDSRSYSRTVSESAKVETFVKPDGHGAVSYEHGRFNARASADGGAAAILTSNVKQVETNRTNELTNINSFSSNEFSGTVYEIEAGSRF